MIIQKTRDGICLVHRVKNCITLEEHDMLAQNAEGIIAFARDNECVFEVGDSKREAVVLWIKDYPESSQRITFLDEFEHAFAVLKELVARHGWRVPKPRSKTRTRSSGRRRY